MPGRLLCTGGIVDPIEGLERLGRLKDSGVNLKKAELRKNGSHYLPDWYDVRGIETTAVLKYQKGRWNLVNSAVGATDVWYGDLGPRQIHPGF